MVCQPAWWGPKGRLPGRTRMDFEGNDRVAAGGFNSQTAVTVSFFQPCPHGRRPSGSSVFSLQPPPAPQVGLKPIRRAVFPRLEKPGAPLWEFQLAEPKVPPWSSVLEADTDCLLCLVSGQGNRADVIPWDKTCPRNFHSPIVQVLILDAPAAARPRL